MGSCIRARPHATMRDSPPLRVPAFCARRFRRSGNRSNTSAIRSSRGRVPIIPPTVRFSRTVRSAKTPFSWGTYPIPRPAVSYGRSADTSSSWNRISPAMRGMSRASVASSVVLPAPLAPSTAKISLPTVKSSPLRTVTPW